MPDPSWSALIECASGQEAYIIGQYAQGEGHYDRMIIALRRAADTGNAPAEALLADIGAPIRSAPESLERAIQYMEHVQRVLGPDHEDSIEAEQAVLVFTMQDRRYRDALALAKNLANRSESVLGPTHRMVLGIKYCIAVCMFRLGDVENGLSRLDAVIDESTRTLGRLASPVSYRRISRIELLAEAGRITTAQEQLDELRTDCSNFPRDHIIMTEIEKTENRILEINRRTKS